MATYENDTYHRETSLVTGNPWLICTLWLAKWYIAKAKENRDLKKALELINWVEDCSLETGIMPEQGPSLHRRVALCGHSDLEPCRVYGSDYALSGKENAAEF